MSHSKEKKRFYSKLGYIPDIKKPKSFNEKIVWKKLFDRNPLLIITADKYKVREYVRLILGDKTADDILVSLLFVGNNPKNIPFEQLPDKYVIKTNHASKTNIFVDRSRIINKNIIIKQLDRWLMKPYGLFAYEWAYQKIQRLIIIEKFLEDSHGRPPKDYKFLMIHGKCELIQVYSNREDELCCSFYDTDWNYQNIQWKHTFGSHIEKPDMLQKMIDISEKLSQPFDFVRVDLYTLDRNIYFGELTHYPASGRLELSPASIDLFLGSKWNNRKQYWKESNNPSMSIYKKIQKPS